MSNVIIEHPDAYEAAKNARIRANANIGRGRRFDAAYPGLRKRVNTTPDLPEFLYESLMEWNGLTEKQAAFALKCLDEREERQAAREKKDADRKANVAPWTPGRQQVEGTIKSARIDDYAVNAYAGLTSMKGLVETDAGQLLWTTIPSKIADEYKWQAQDLRGVRVTFTVTVKPKDEDPTFAFGSRPAVKK